MHRKKEEQLNIMRLVNIQMAFEEEVYETNGVKREEILDDHILWLQSELGECAKEWGEFKYLRTHHSTSDRSRLLEEYVDSLKMTVSLGILVGYPFDRLRPLMAYNDDSNITETFSKLNAEAHEFKNKKSYQRTELQYLIFFSRVVNLGKQLGFSASEIEEVFINKTQVNLKRQGVCY